MARSRARLAAGLLVVWTVLVWTARIGNIWRDDDLSTSDKVGRTLLALSFTVLAGAVVAMWRGNGKLFSRAVLALAGWTVLVWAVRDTKIVLGDHDVGFKLVHTVLALVSIGLAVWAVLSLRTPSGALFDDRADGGGDSGGIDSPSADSGFGLSPSAD
jgi:hypothetical protein